MKNETGLLEKSFFCFVFFKKKKKKKMFGSTSGVESQLFNQKSVPLNSFREREEKKKPKETKNLSNFLLKSDGKEHIVWIIGLASDRISESCIVLLQKIFSCLVHTNKFWITLESIRQQRAKQQQRIQSILFLCFVSGKKKKMIRNEQKKNEKKKANYLSATTLATPFS